MCWEKAWRGYGTRWTWESWRFAGICSVNFKINRKAAKVLSPLQGVECGGGDGSFLQPWWCWDWRDEERFTGDHVMGMHSSSDLPCQWEPSWRWEWRQFNSILDSWEGNDIGFGDGLDTREDYGLNASTGGWYRRMATKPSLAWATLWFPTRTRLLEWHISSLSPHCTHGDLDMLHAWDTSTGE